MTRPAKKTTAKGIKANSKKSALKKTDADIVALYMDKLDHPLRNEIEAVRLIIRNSNKNISERIKWNAPSYYYKEDLVTFNLRTPKFVHLVFHHPSIIRINSPLLEGDYKDRRMMYLHNMDEVKASKKALESIINELVSYIDS